MKLIYKTLLIGLLSLGSCGDSHANDFGVSGVGGSWRPLKGQHRSVRMVRENVRINIYAKYDNNAGFYMPSYCDVTADFTFQNTGPAVTVSMAFPERGEGAGETGESGFTNFATYVNGTKTKVRRVVTKLEKDGDVYGNYQALWVKQVPFKRGETKSVRVRYRAEPGSAADVGSFASYDFTGANWRGDVAESTLTVKMDSHCKFLKSTFNSKKLAMKANAGEYSTRWTNWQAQGRFQFWFTVPRLRSE